ncbi:MAG: protein kinase, partial [Mycobacterium sp.]|nr:protein kinase [Mycobacterium sp.]
MFLPPEIEEALAAVCLEGVPADRQSAVEDLVGCHPQWAAAILALAADLVAVTALLETASVAPEPVELREIGGHRVVRMLGEGAFGAVYLCRQQSPVVRDVAVKVLRAGWVDRRVLARFEAERQLLAELSHPTITQVYDAGVLADGRPFLVMEYIDGLPITAFCAARQLPLRQRLELFVRVCRGVAHANARGIVHR